MYREFYSTMASTTLPLVTMLFFAVVFAAILLRTFVVKRRRDYDHVAALPLADAPTAHGAGAAVPNSPAASEVNS